MKTTCLVNSYNYRHFIVEAVDSALSQSRPVDQIVVVDDGSTDGSIELLREKYADEPSVEIVSQPNGGQLSCFEIGVKLAKGDVIFFLDADDLWEPAYVQTTIETYRDNPDTDFVFCGLRRFGKENGTHLPWAEDRALGYSVALTSFRRIWKGAATSALSMRRWVLDRIFPVPFVEDWRIRADDCLVYGADLVGASKYYLAQPLVGYRVHDSNNYYGRTWSDSSKYKRKLALGRFVRSMQDRMGWEVERLPSLAHLEFETIARPTAKDFWCYSALVWRADCSIKTRVERLIRMSASGLRRARRGDHHDSRRTGSKRYEAGLAESRSRRLRMGDRGAADAAR